MHEAIIEFSKLSKQAPPCSSPSHDRITMLPNLEKLAFGKYLTWAMKNIALPQNVLIVHAHMYWSELTDKQKGRWILY